MATTYMSLSLPTVSTTPGPTYAALVNSAFEAVDAHDHTSGKGVQVPTAGININANLEFNTYAALELAYIGLETQGSAPSTTKTVYVNTSGDLYYKNSSGTAVQITSGGAVAAVGSGLIGFTLLTGSSYSVTNAADSQKVLGVPTSSAYTLNLPAASAAPGVWWFAIKDVTGSAATNNISIVPNGADTIDGVAATRTINENYAAYELVSNGSNGWWLL